MTNIPEKHLYLSWEASYLSVLNKNAVRLIKSVLILMPVGELRDGGLKGLLTFKVLRISS